MATFRAPHAVAAVTILMAVALVLPGSWGGILFATLAMALPSVLLLLAQTQRPGSSRRLVAAAAVTGALLVGGMLSLIVLSGRDPTHPWLLGLPVPLAIQVYGIALGPLVVLGLAFAWDFECSRPDPEDLERIRSLSEKGS